MSFLYSVTLSDPDNLTTKEAALSATVHAVLEEFSAYVTGYGTLNVRIDISPTLRSRAEGGPGKIAFVRDEGGREIWTSGAVEKLTTGNDPDPGKPDIIFKVDPTYLENELWLAAGSIAGSSVPADKTDGLSVFRHEFVHGLVMSGWRSIDTGQLQNDPKKIASPWDMLVSVNGGLATFNGPYAMAIYGAPVPVTTIPGGQEYFHLGNSTDSPIVGKDLMNGIVFTRGATYHISDLDIAILKDLGLNAATSPDDALNGTSGNDRIVRLGGDDSFCGGSGDDYLFGGSGHDTAQWSSSFAESSFVFRNHEVLVINAEGQDTVSGVEVFKFSDLTIEGDDQNALVDDLFYFATQRDVAAAGIDPEVHYRLWGWIEGRDPNQDFSTSRYLSANPDVAAAGVNPLEHYLAYGHEEGRQAYTSAYFDGGGYLA